MPSHIFSLYTLPKVGESWYIVDCAQVFCVVLCADRRDLIASSRLNMCHSPPPSFSTQVPLSTRGDDRRGLVPSHLSEACVRGHGHRGEHDPCPRSPERRAMPAGVVGRRRGERHFNPPRGEPLNRARPSRRSVCCVPFSPTKSADSVDSTH